MADTTDPATSPDTTVKAEGQDNTKHKEEGIEVEGIVKETLKGKFRVEIPSTTKDGEPHYVLAHIAGKLRRHYIKIVTGDRVKVEVSPYDITRGRITFRLKG